MSETKRHLMARTTLFLLLEEAYSRTAAVGSDQFVYLDAGDPRRCLSPDAFVKLGACGDDIKTWKVWERGAPDMAVEIVSDSDRSDSEWTLKLARYQASGIHEVVRFDEEDEERPLRVWDRVDGELVERSRTSPGLRECVTLGLWWVVVPSPRGPLLRLARDSEGKALLPTPDEERLRLAEELAEERKARSLAEHELVVAEHQRKLAEQKLTNAEQKLTGTEQKLTGAEQKLREEAEQREKAAAEIERLRAEIARLRGG